MVIKFIMLHAKLFQMGKAENGNHLGYVPDIVLDVVFAIKEERYLDARHICMKF